DDPPGRAICHERITIRQGLYRQRTRHERVRLDDELGCLDVSIRTQDTRVDLVGWVLVETISGFPHNKNVAVPTHRRCWKGLLNLAVRLGVINEIPFALE